MARSFLLPLISLACLCVRAIVAVPDRIIGAINYALAFMFRPEPFGLDRLFDGPALALVGPAGRSISPALAHDQKHEAGLARLGAVRHR